MFDNKCFEILIDTREQRPFLFNDYDIATRVCTLKTGDYSARLFSSFLEPWEDTGCVVERKSLNDLIGCFTVGRERFEKELERMREYKSCAIIVESPYRALASGRYHSKMNPQSAIQTFLSFSQKYRVPFIFAETRENAEFLTFSFLKHYCKHLHDSTKK